MDQEIRKLKKLVKLMRSEGVLTLKQGQTCIALHPSALDHLPDGVPAQDGGPQVETVNEESSDAALFWSSPGVLANEADQ